MGCATMRVVTIGCIVMPIPMPIPDPNIPMPIPGAGIGAATMPPIVGGGMAGYAG